MTRSPDSQVPSGAGQPATEKRDDKAFKSRPEGEANLWAATPVNVVSASSPPPAIKPIQLEFIPGRACLCKAKPATDRKLARERPVRRDGVEDGGTANPGYLIAAAMLCEGVVSSVASDGKAAKIPAYPAIPLKKIYLIYFGGAPAVRGNSKDSERSLRLL